MRKQALAERKAQEQLRLEKWKAGNSRKREFLVNIAFYAVVLALLALSVIFNIVYIAAPTLLCVVLGRLLKVPKMGVLSLGMFAFSLVWLLWTSTGEPSATPEGIEYQVKTLREAGLVKQVKLTPLQLIDMANRDIAQIDPEGADLMGQKNRLKQAKVELDEIEEPTRSGRVVTELYVKIAALREAIQRHEKHVAK